MIAGAYELHLYCDYCNRRGEFVSSFRGGLTETVKAAKAKGWTVTLSSGNERCYCPHHNSKVKRPDLAKLNGS